MNPKRTKSFGIDNLSFFDRILFKMRCNMVLKDVDLDDKIIIDTGCGYNALTLQYIQKHYKPRKLIALDLKLNTVYLNSIGIEAIEGNLNEGRELKNKADVIISTAILEHLEHPESYLKNAHENLNNNGVLLMTIPSIYAKPVLEFIAYRLKIIDKAEILDHKQYYNRAKLISKLTHAGFLKPSIHHKYFQFFMNNYIKAIKG